MTAAQDHEKVGHHRSLAFLIQLDNALFGESRECHLNHAHCAVEDPRASGHDRTGLLSLQHYLGYLRSVRQAGDARLNNVDAHGDDSGRNFSGEPVEPSDLAED